MPYNTFYDSADGQYITLARSIQLLGQHGVAMTPDNPDLDDFTDYFFNNATDSVEERDNGKFRTVISAQKVLDWLGY